MSKVYRPRHPERTVFYSILFHYFEPFLLEYENQFERHFGHLKPIIQKVVDKYLDCGNPKCGFARIRCPDCGAERLLMFSCKTRGFCPSSHAKRREEWGEWMREKLILDTPHRQVVFTTPKRLRVFFKFNRSLLSALCVCGKEALIKYLKAATERDITPGIIGVIQLFGSRINFHPHLHFLVTEGGTDKKGQFHKVSLFNDPLICPQCGGTMRIVSFIEDYKVIDKIIKHLNLTFKATRPPPPQANLRISDGLNSYFLGVFRGKMS